MKVCAIVPTYKRPELLVESVRSLLEQTRRPDTIVIADDGGDRELTARAIAPFKNEVLMTWHPNAGKAATLNRAIAQTEADLVWIVDDDDLVAGDALERLERPLIADPDAMFSFGFHDDLVLQNRQWVFVEPSGAPSFTHSDLKLSVLDRCFIFQPGMLVRRSAYKEVGPFDETLLRSQDYDMLLRLTRRFRGVMVNGVVFHQRQHEGERGPESQRTAAADRATKWAEADRRIFERIHSSYEISEFAPSDKPQRNDSRKAQAFINRAIIMARRGLWEYAVSDLVSLAEMLRSGVDPIDLDLAGFSRVLGRQSYALSGASSGAFFRQFVVGARQLPAPIAANILGRTSAPLLGWIRAAAAKRQWGRLRALALMAASVGPAPILRGYREFRSVSTAPSKNLSE